MKITQIVTTFNQPCGIAYFAKNLNEQFINLNIKMDIISELTTDGSSDILILHYHSELFEESTLISFCNNVEVPIIVFAHSEGAEILNGLVHGFVGMCEKIFPENCQPNLIIPHPAWIPAILTDRKQLRKNCDLPINRTIIGSNGFLKFERQFDVILDRLLPVAKKNNWLVYLLVSPWYIESPGLFHKLSNYKTIYSNFFDFQYSYLEKRVLNEKLQSFDLLWCWTNAPSSPYASGVISDQYASGTRIFATDKIQHGHILRLPNVVKGSTYLDDYINQLIDVISVGDFQRHDPSIISWKNNIQELYSFVNDIYNIAEL